MVQTVLLHNYHIVITRTYFAQLIEGFIITHHFTLQLQRQWVYRAAALR